MTYCAARDDPNTAWPGFCPNTGAAVFFALLFFGTVVAHTVQGIAYRKWYSIVITMSAIWQTAAYGFRVASIQKPDMDGIYTAWFVLILLAPLWANAYVYMVLGRMIYNFTSVPKVWGIPAWRYGLSFVLLDIIAFIIQAAGASMASGDNVPHNQVETGLHIYMGGIGFQLFFILVFSATAIKARQSMIRDTVGGETAKAMSLLNTLFGVLLLITIRIIFRLVEYSSGLNSKIPTHEAYQYIFDSLMMLIALVLLNIVHPGRIMPGKESDLPSRKARKAIGKGNVRGRAGGSALPLYQTSQEGKAEEGNGMNM